MSTSSSTFESYNSIIETNSTNKKFEDFEEKFKATNAESAVNSTESSSRLNTIADACENNLTNSQNIKFKTLAKNSNSIMNSDISSLRSSRFKKKFEKLKRLNKLVNQHNELNESKLDIIDYNKIQPRFIGQNNSTLKMNEQTRSSDKKNLIEELKRILKKQDKKENSLRIKTKRFAQPTVASINLSQLQHLSLRNLGVNVIKPVMLNNLLKNFQCLKYLDISNCCTNQLHYSTNNNTRILNGNLIF